MDDVINYITNNMDMLVMIAINVVWAILDLSTSAKNKTIKKLEKTMGKDLDGDGKIGKPTEAVDSPVKKEIV